MNDDLDVATDTANTLGSNLTPEVLIAFAGGMIVMLVLGFSFRWFKERQADTKLKNDLATCNGKLTKSIADCNAVTDDRDKAKHVHNVAASKSKERIAFLEAEVEKLTVLARESDEEREKLEAKIAEQPEQEAIDADIPTRLLTEAGQYRRLKPFFKASKAGIAAFNKAASAFNIHAKAHMDALKNGEEPPKKYRGQSLPVKTITLLK